MYNSFIEKSMKHLFSTIFALIFCGQLLMAKPKLPVIKATSKFVDIKYDGKFLKKTWIITPEEELDIYRTSAKNVVFYTDIDSISFSVSPGEAYNFIIVLNGKDTARTQIKYETSRLDILKNAWKYDYSDKRFTPIFSYQSKDAPELQKIRKELKLDSIAGKGSELSQIFNLMHWVHSIVRHDGISNSPKSRNSIDLINICKAENRGINCRMMATILNECYLSLGIPSRFVTCLPKESEFEDCHVINMAYSSDLQKWIWIDPTFDAYVMDENGNLLSIEEVREKLIQGKPLILNADANWNKENLQTKENYLETYMAKNLYRLETPVRSEYNAETSSAGKEVEYIQLLPLDGLQQSPQKEEYSNKDTGIKLITYKTNNPQIFWQKQ